MTKKFRFYDKEYSQWRELPDLLGDYVSCAFRTYGDGFDIKYFLNSEARTKVKDGVITIQQWTGLLDKNGREIYEGDIVSFRKANWDSEASNYIGEVVFEKSQFIYKIKNGSKIPLSDWTYFPHLRKIIGNIFENPLDNNHQTD